MLANVHQRLSLWSGTIDSSFEYAGETVSVTTAAHPERAQVAFRIESPLLATGLLEIGIAFPYASDGFMQTADWDAGDRHSTAVEKRGDGARISRTLDATTYTVELSWNAAVLRATEDPHRLRLGTDENRLDLVVSYTDRHDVAPRDTVDGVLDAAERWWETFWLGARPWTSPAARTLGRRSWSGGSCSRSTSPQ